MGENRDIKILAAYSISSGLYDARKDIYTIIAGFIADIIVNKGIQQFTDEKMYGYLKSEYNFDLPKSIVKASVKRLEIPYDPGLSKYVVDGNFKSKYQGEFNRNNEYLHLGNCLVKDYYDFIEKKEGRPLQEDEKAKYLKDFMNLLVEIDDSNAENYPSLFTLECNASNSKLYKYSKYIEAVRQGAILYLGLNYDSDISNSKKIWRDPLRIFFEPEYLFSLAGFNGEACQADANELLDLIKEMNSAGGHIQMFYFPDVKDEIEDFFRTAEDIVEGVRELREESTAMITITDGCKTASDVQTLKAMPFQELVKNSNIKKFDETEYYLDHENQYNLIPAGNWINKFREEGDKDRYCNHPNYINILRMGHSCSSIKDSNYILVTDTGRVHTYSRELTKKDRKKHSPLTISTNLLACLIWLNLGKGFGADDFPDSLNVLFKAKAGISSNMTKIFFERLDNVKQEYLKRRDAGEDTEEIKNQYIDMIEQIRNKDRLIENISPENGEEYYRMLFDDTDIQNYSSSKLALQRETDFLRAVNKKKEEQLEEEQKRNRAKDNTIKNNAQEIKTLKKKNQNSDRRVYQRVQDANDIVDIIMNNIKKLATNGSLLVVIALVLGLVIYGLKYGLSKMITSIAAINDIWEFAISIIMVIAFLKSDKSEGLKNIVSGKLDKIMQSIEERIRKHIYKQRAIIQDDIEIYEQVKRSEKSA